MDWLPPIEVSRISDGGKVIPHKVPHSVIFLSQKCAAPFSFSHLNIERVSAFLILPPSFLSMESKRFHTEERGQSQPGSPIPTPNFWVGG
jgi:hypothetical protein